MVELVENERLAVEYVRGAYRVAVDVGSIHSQMMQTGFRRLDALLASARGGRGRQ